MEVIIRKTTHEAVKMTADLIAAELHNTPTLKLGLATGRTMEAVYNELVNLHTNEDLDFSSCTTFNLDEYIGLPSKDKHSYRYYMNTHLFDRVNINKNQTHLPNGVAQDEVAEGERYEKLIKESGGVNIQLLGIGVAGHIGFNEPISSLVSRTRSKALTPETCKQNSPLFDDPENMPKRAYTMGVGTILDAKRIILLATGAEKADIIAKAVEGPVTSMVTGSALQLHPRVTVIIDQAASTKLTQTDYYNWIFQNEPEWEAYRP